MTIPPGTIDPVATTGTFLTDPVTVIEPNWTDTDAAAVSLRSMFAYRGRFDEISDQQVTTRGGSASVSSQ